MAAMREGDVLLHHPYDSFSSSVERLVERPSTTRVLAIKQTCTARATTRRSSRR